MSIRFIAIDISYYDVVDSSNIILRLVLFLANCDTGILCETGQGSRWLYELDGMGSGNPGQAKCMVFSSVISLHYIPEAGKEQARLSRDRRVVLHIFSP